MYHSAETRWFIEGPLPAELDEWFRSSTAVREEPGRTDEYLLLPGCTTTGVKLREGRLEIKAETHPAANVSYGPGIDARRDAWVKWSRPIGDGGTLRNIRTADEDRWIYVRKARHLRVVSLDSETPVELDDAGIAAEDGCQLELSVISAAAGRVDESPSAIDWASSGAWWSLSLEAFAPAAPDMTARLFDNLDAGAAHLFQIPPPIKLARETSRSYPAWLQQFVSP